MARFPIQNPELILKKQFRRVEGARSGQNKQGMTANELAVNQKKETEKTRKQAKKEATIL